MSFYSNSLFFLWKFLNTRSVEDLNRLIYLAVLICLVLFCYYTNPLVCLFVFVTTTLPGAVFTHFYFSGRLRNYFGSETQCIRSSKFYQTNAPEELQCLTQQKSETLNEADIESELDRTISHFSEILVSNFISEWYSSLVSDNPELPDKAYPLINLAISNLCDRAQSLPLSQLSSHLLLHGLIPHFSSIQRAIIDTNSAVSVSIDSLLERLQLPRTVHNFEACEYAHPALRNQAATHMYSEHIFDLLLQASDLPSSLKDSFLFRSVLRDVISTSFLLKLFDIISKPHFIYKCITFVFSLQFPSNSNRHTVSARNTTQVNRREYSDDVIDSETESFAPLRMKKLMGRKSKSYDIPDRFSRCAVRKHSNTTQYQTIISSKVRVGREVPMSASQNSISIFDHELVHDSLSYSFYLYSIWVPEVITDKFNQSEACIVKHRFREFEQLYRLLQNKYKDLMRGISFPSKLSQIRIGSLTNEFIMRRRMLLERFLKSMCVRDQLLQSPEVQIFLGISTLKKQELNRQSTYSRSSKTFNTSDFAAAQNVEDVVLKLRVFVTKQLLSSADTPESLLSPTAQTADQTQHTEYTPDNTEDSIPEITPITDTKDSIPLKQCLDTERELLSLTRQLCRVTLDILNGADVDTDTRAGELMEKFPFMSSLYLFGVTALRNKQLWINTETFLILLLEMLGESSTRTLQGKMDGLNTDERLSAYFEMLERKFFPEGKLTLVSSNPVSREELGLTKTAACDAIVKFLPDLIESVAGENELRRTISYCLDCLSNQAINRHLLLRLFDIILLYLVPELTEETFQQSLGIQHSNPQSTQY